MLDCRESADKALFKLYHSIAKMQGDSGEEIWSYFPPLGRANFLAELFFCRRKNFIYLIYKH
ncbi:MAG: hypothetical protein UY99_C0001G0020 [Parcubacteria group bacterium GW2011_GWA1_59_11]|nr:MAG: hypothetical protein UY99_C0001G0020 [Parcubacteria group bacterium GW2011_GWA1_59_11]